MPRNLIHYYLMMIYYTVRNKLFPIYTGPSTVKYIGVEEEIPKALRTGNKRTIRVNYYNHTPYNLVIGNIYQSERQDRISYYIKDVGEVNKRNFIDITEERNKLLKKIGV